MAARCSDKQQENHVVENWRQQETNTTNTPLFLPPKKAAPTLLHQMASTSAASPGADTARQRWEMENAVSSSAEADAYYKYDTQEQADIQREKPWKKDPHYFKRHVR